MNKPTLATLHPKKKFKFAIISIIPLSLTKRFSAFGMRLILSETVIILTRQGKLGKAENYSSSASNSFRMVE